MAVALVGPHRAAGLRPFRRALETVDEVVYDVIRDRRGAADLDQRDDILSLLMQARHEDGRPMADVELRDELMTLLIAGHETTATGLSWALERLLRHPGKLARLREEVEAGEDAYAEAVVRETLRLRPVLPLVVRRLTQPVTIAGYDLPAGVTVSPCIYLIHRRADVYPDPAAFRPERFIEQPPGTYTWIPFGGGVRRCLGASFALFEMKTVLSVLVSNLDLRPARARSERVRRRAITLAPEHGAEIVVGSRTREAVAA
jgi:cytochrome P450